MLDKILWAWDRWKIMDHPREEIYRIKQQVQYHIIDRQWYTHLPIAHGFSYDNTTSLLKAYSKEGLRKVIQATTGNIKEFRLLNVIIEDITANEKWNYDFKNHIQGKRAFVHEIDDFDYASGEIKYIYELSRLYHVPMLAAFAIGKSNSNLLKRIEKQLYKWYEQNPFLGSVAWKSGNVVGIRALNLVLYRTMLGMACVDCTDIDMLLNPLMELHYKFLISHFSLFSSKGNHHIGELVGAIAICATYKFHGAEEALQSYWTELLSETLRLIHKDGFNKEQAIRYQASYINLIIFALCMAKARGLEPPEQVCERIKQMYLMLDTFRIHKNEFFHVGDDDNAELIYPYFDKTYNIYESMLNDSALLFGFPKKTDYHFDLRNYFLTGDKGLEKYKTVQMGVMEKKMCRLYADSGYFIVKDEHICLLFDVGKIGLPPSMSHGHSDILNVILYIENKPILVDCGSYQYNARYKRLRDYFHGIHSHNTVSVDRLDQAVPSSGMFWLTSPQVTVSDYSEDNEYPMCVARHDGYERKKMQVTHQRKVKYEKKEKMLWIFDTLCMDAQHEISYYLHFHPDANVIHEYDNLVVNGNVILKNPLFKQGQMVFGDKGLPAGWYSKQYDAIEPTHSFVLRIPLAHSSEITTCIKF